jgi:hypothetical protein
MKHEDEFYIGYEPALPPGIGRSVRLTVIAVALIVIGIASLLAGVQRPLAASSFEFGTERTWTGWLVRTPAPALIVQTAHGQGRFWLVGRGKRGAETAIGSLPEGWVRVKGTLISRDPWRMIEAREVTPTRAPAPGSPPVLEPTTAARLVTLRGEIVDSKCFLGVMNPGERVVHRDCAIRCLSGGVPPMLAFQDDRGRVDLAVLVDAGGRLLHGAVHDAVGRPVQAHGRLFTINGQPVFQLASLAGVTR